MSQHIRYPANASDSNVAGAKTFSGLVTLGGSAVVPAGQNITTNALQSTSGGTVQVFDNFAFTGKLTANAFLDTSGTPGSATANKTCGRSALAAGAAACTITNSWVQPGDIVHCQLETADATATRMICVAAAGSFLATANANATGITKFSWFVVRTS